VADEPSYQSLVYVPISEGGHQRNRAQRAEEQRLCYEYRLLGHTIREIAVLASADLGWSISRDTVHRRIEAEGLQNVQPAEEALRTLELDRLDRYLLAAERVAGTTKQPAVALQAMDRCLKIQERRAKLLGLDAPERHNVLVHEVDPADAELAEMIRLEKAKDA